MTTKLRFLGATITDLKWSPLENEESKFKLYLYAPLTTKLADTLQCRGLCYSEPDGNAGCPIKEQVQPSARQWKGSISIPVEISGGDILLGERNFPFTLLHNVKVERDEKEDSLALFVEMIIHLDGKELLLYKFCQETLKKRFSFIVTPAQGAFKFMDEADGEDEEESTAAEAPASSGTLARKGAMKKGELEPVNA